MIGTTLLMLAWFLLLALLLVMMLIQGKHQREIQALSFLIELQEIKLKQRSNYTFHSSMLPSMRQQAKDGSKLSLKDALEYLK